MFDQREEFLTAEYKRYSAECRRLAAAARPRPHAKTLAPKRLIADRFGAVIQQLRQPAGRERKLIAIWAQR